jgi:hypothetical protein
VAHGTSAFEAVGVPFAERGRRTDAALEGMYGLPPELAATVPITGRPAEAAERFAEYAAVGAEHLVLGIVGQDWLRQCELIAEARALLD